MGFISPFAALANLGPEDMTRQHPLGFDTYYRDAEGRAPGEPGFARPLPTGCVPLTGPDGKLLDPEYKDAAGLMPGQAGFTPPAPLYTAAFVDAKGFVPGDAGFVPPLTGLMDLSKRKAKAAGLKAGYDGEYRDCHGRSPGTPGFIPPAYNLSYSDREGRRPGENGFVPPPRRATAVPPGAAPLQGLPAGAYDGGYRTADGLRPGDKGFVPLARATAALTQAQAAQQFPDGHDKAYRDDAGRASDEAGFVPPMPTGMVPFVGRDGATPLPADHRDAAGRRPWDAGFEPPEPLYGPHYVDRNGLRPGDVGFIPPLQGITGEQLALKTQGLPKVLCPIPPPSL